MLLAAALAGLLLAPEAAAIPAPIPGTYQVLSQARAVSRAPQQLVLALTDEQGRDWNIAMTPNGFRRIGLSPASAPGQSVLIFIRRGEAPVGDTVCRADNFGLRLLSIRRSEAP